MGFSENFKITISDTRAYKCFGNSVVVPVVEKIAKAMIDSSTFKNTSTFQKMTTESEMQVNMLN